MRTPRAAVARVLAVLTVLILLSTACGGGDEVDTLETTSTSSEKPHPRGATGDVWPSTEATTIAADPDALHLTFNGESCTYDGPTELTPGPVELVFLNESEENARTVTVIIDEGHTVQDVIDDLGAEPSTGQQPPWTKSPPSPWVDAPPWAPERGTGWSTEPGETFRREVDLEAGLYAMACARLSPHLPEFVVTVLGVWFGTGLTVEG